MMIKSHVIKLYPTKSQEILLRKSCGVARFAYNWALDKWNKDYEAGIKSDANSIIKHLTAIKREEFPWMLEVSKTCPQYAILNLEKAYLKMWAKDAKYPRFKKKGVKDSFVAVENKEAFNQKDFKIHIPRIGKIKCAENLRFEGKVNNVVVKRVADMWFAAINIETMPTETPALRESQATVGVDVGIKSLIILSDGTVYENPKALKNNMRSLKRMQRSLSRKVKGSNNHKKQQMRVARKYYRIGNIRKNATHQATTEIVRKYDKIVIESLNVAGLIKNRKISQAIIDASFGEISRQLSYKSQWAGVELVKADKFFASSKTFSNCGHKKEKLKLSERIYRCDQCGLEIDRDLNAAKNLAKYSSTSELEGCKASGEGSPIAEMQCSPSAKEESNFITIKI